MKFLFTCVTFITFSIISTQCKLKNDNVESNANYPDTLIKPLEDMKPDKPVSFGYKCVWIAVKTTDKEKVATIVGVKSRSTCNWSAGIEKAYEDKIFITPSVRGWTFIIGYGLPHGDNKKNIDTLKTILNNLSKEFGEAQFFGTHRVVSFVCWIKSTNGKTSRVYSYADGENIVVEGDPTEVEKKMNLINTLSSEAKDPKYFDKEDLTMPDEEEVMKVANAWSIDPTKLEQLKDIEPALGILGK